MRVSFLSIIAVLLVFSYGTYVGAQEDVFTANLSLGSRGTQVLTLQKLLNQDMDTSIASSGPGSPGNETSYFGQLTKSAVIKFQEKYTSEILAPAGLTRGNGRVWLYTRAKLNAIRLQEISQTPAPAPAPAPETVTTVTDYAVKDSEKIDIYTGDKMIENVQNRILSAINASIVAQSTATATMPVITASDVPNVVIKELSPRSGMQGARISITGTEISSNSAIYFGNSYVVRTISQDALGNFSFVVPSIPPARYDVAVKTYGDISNTATFVITDPKNPSVHIQSVYPSTIKYGGTLTITGSGFTPQNNTVVTTYQKFANIPSADGKTLTVQIAPDSLRELSKFGRGTDKVPTSVYVVNGYGFSDSEKSFNISI